MFREECVYQYADRRDAETSGNLTSPCVGSGDREGLLESRLQVQQVIGCLGVAEGNE